MSADAINQTSNAATYHGVRTEYRTTHSILMAAFFDEIGIDFTSMGTLKEASWKDIETIIRKIPESFFFQRK